MILGAPVLLSACGEGNGNGNGNGNGAGGDALDRIRKAGVVRVGFIDDAPYSFEDGRGNLTGQAPTVVGEIFAEFGIAEMEGVQVGWDSLIPSLNDGQFDVIAAGMFISGERCEAVAFSNPDYCGTTAFAVAEGNPLGIAAYDDIAASSDIRLGVLRGAPEGLLYAEDAGIPDDQVTSFPGITAMFQGLIDDQVDAISLTTIALNWTHQQRYADAPIEVTEGFAPVVHGEEILRCGGYAFRHDDADLVAEFNKSLHRLQTSGRLLELLEPFGFSTYEVEMAQEHTAAELCRSDTR